MLTIYTCGLCHEQYIINTIQNHLCIQGCKEIVVTESNYFYPQIGKKIKF